MPAANLSLAAKQKLKAIPVKNVRLGTKGGLPFEFLATDLYAGCLPLNSLCYGNCSQGLLALEQGYDFGVRRLNHFNADLIAADIGKLSSEQRWIRQGWNSDISFSDEGWNRTALLAEMLRQHGRHLLIITKVFKSPPASVLKRLQRCHAEIRVSISAIDGNIALERRLRFLHAYRELGGLSVPYLMTALFADNELQVRQSAILEWICHFDYPAGEHPLRLERGNPITSYLDLNSVHQHPKFPNQLWFGRIYPHQLRLPAPPSLKSSYQGLPHTSASLIDWQGMEAHFEHGTPTNQQLIYGTADLSHPNLFRHGTAFNARPADIES